MDGGLRLLLSQGSGVESWPVSPPLGEGRAPLGGRSGLRKAEKFWARGSGERRRGRTAVAGPGRPDRGLVAGRGPRGWKPRGACFALRLLSAQQVLGQGRLQPGPSDVSPGAVGRGRPGRASVAVRALPVLLPGRAQCWGTWASPEGHGVDHSDAPGPRKCPAKVSVSGRVLPWPVDVRLSPQGCRRLGVAPRAGCPWCRRARA